MAWLPGIEDTNYTVDRLMFKLIRQEIDAMIARDPAARSRLEIAL